MCWCLEENTHPHPHTHTHAACTHPRIHILSSCWGRIWDSLSCTLTWTWFGSGGISGGIRNCILLLHLALICANAGPFAITLARVLACMHVCLCACVWVIYIDQCVYTSNSASHLQIHNTLPFDLAWTCCRHIRNSNIYIHFVSWNHMYASIFKQKPVPISKWFTHDNPINNHIRSHAQERIEAVALQHHKAVK